MCCFFFKQKTAYEMRISDWSSDVCSSDLGSGRAAGGARRRTQHGRGVEYGAAARPIVQKKPCARRGRTDPTWRRGESCGERPSRSSILRSEERRVGKGCVGTCRYRGLSEY